MQVVPGRCSLSSFECLIVSFMCGQSVGIIVYDRLLIKPFDDFKYLSFSLISEWSLILAHSFFFLQSFH